MKHTFASSIKNFGLLVLGWVLVVVGVAALVLPGPGLLALFAGLALLANHYSWAARRLEPVKRAAFKTARQSVASWPRIGISVILAFALIGAGVIWGLHPAVPGWWPVSNRLWLVGGWGTGGTLIGSGIIAASMIVYSYVTFRLKHS